MQLLSDTADRSRFDSVLNDVKEACSLAIELLNDLLLYDKVEEGVFILDVETVTAKPLLLKVVSMFQVQVIFQ